MPDRGTVITAPPKTPKGGKTPKAGAVRPLTVKIGEVTVDAVRIKDALYQPSEGDDVVTVPLSNDTVLVLGPA